MSNELKWFNNWSHFTWGTEGFINLIFKSDIRTWKVPFTGSLDHKDWRGELDENWGSRVGTVVLWLEAAHIIIWSLKLCLCLGDLDIIFKVLLLDGVQSSSPAPITHGVVTGPVCLSLFLALCWSLSVAYYESILPSSDFFPQRGRKKDCAEAGDCGWKCFEIRKRDSRDGRHFTLLSGEEHKIEEMQRTLNLKLWP